MTLNESRNELRSIINELQDIEWGIRHEHQYAGAASQSRIYRGGNRQ